MPSPRSGTVTTDIASAVREFKAGKIEFRNDKGGNVAAPVGKLSFSEEQLVENINAFLNHLRSLKPAAAKGTYIRSVTVSATMSPGIRVWREAAPLDLPAVAQAADLCELALAKEFHEQIRQRTDDGPAQVRSATGADRS